MNVYKWIERGVEIFIEIIVMIFDEFGRWFIIGGRDGSVKIWNFNNGSCF